MTSWVKANSSSTEGNLPPPRGLVCPLVTPLAEDGKIDHRSLRRLLAHVERWADALLLADLRWGEAAQLGMERRLELVSAAMQLVEGRRPLMVCVTGTSLNETRALEAELHRAATQTGYRGPLYAVDYPLVYHGNRDLPRLLAEDGERQGLPLIIGNDPKRIRSIKGAARHSNIRTAVLKKIATVPGVCAMIFQGSLKRGIDYQAAVRPGKGFLFYDGDEAVFLNNPGMGGVVAGGSNLLPEDWKHVIRSSMGRCDIDRQVRSHQRDVWESGELLAALYRLCRPDPAARLKHILARCGLIASEVTASGISGGGQAWRSERDRFLKRCDLT
ncbi:MAG: dihydrodipicolinate synthase family protein [Desulfobacterales bacterium]|jgi:dihydrodipicolinate synthase/N-acetylneuraminate lyase